MESGLSAGIAQAIARHLGRPSAAVLLRGGANEVYAVDDLVIRLAPPGVDVEQQARVVDLLARHGVAVPALVAAGNRGGQPYTVWERVVADEVEGIDFRLLGAEIGRLHRIDPGAVDEPALPWCDEAGWLDLDVNLTIAQSAGVVSGADIEILRGHWDELRSWGDRCRAAGPPVVCHGDVHPQNAIMGGGRPVVIDWDTICLGPPQWDHAMLMTWASRWGGEPAAYPDFAAGYGTNFAADELATDLARLRLLAPTVNLIAKGAHSPRHAAEAQRRMRFWRGEQSAPAWLPQ